MSKTKKPVKPTQPAKATPQASTKPFMNDLQFALVVTGIFYLLSLVGALNHESWRDEYQAFLLGERSSSVGNLMYNMEYDGHALLWQLLIFIQTRFADSMVVTKIFHCTVAASTVWLICRYLPLKLWQRGLLCFSYFLFYEYNLIARPYALGLMFFTLSVVMYRFHYIRLALAQNKSTGTLHVFIFSAVLFLLANTSIFGIVMCGCMLALLFSDTVASFSEKRTGNGALLRYFIPMATGAVGMVLCYLFLRPKPGNSFPMLYTTGFDPASMKAALARLFSNLVLLLPDGMEFWNKHRFDTGTLTWMPWAGFLILAVSALYFLRNNRLLLFYLTAVAGVFGFVYVTNMLHVRYSGHWFVMLVMGYVLSLDYKNAKPLLPIPKIGNAVQFAFVVLLNATFVINAVAGVTAYAKDITHPFSNLENAGAYVVEERLDRFPVVGATDFVISPLSYFIRKPIRLAESQRTGYFMRWDQQRRSEKLSFLDVIAEVSTVMNEDHDTVLVILDTPLRFVINGQTVDFVEDDLPGTDIHLKFFHGIENPCIVEDEQFYFYMATRVVVK